MGGSGEHIQNSGSGYLPAVVPEYLQIALQGVGGAGDIDDFAGVGGDDLLDRFPGKSGARWVDQQTTFRTGSGFFEQFPGISGEKAAAIGKIMVGGILFCRFDRFRIQFDAAAMQIRDF